MPLILGARSRASSTFSCQGCSRPCIFWVVWWGWGLCVVAFGRRVGGYTCRVCHTHTHIYNTSHQHNKKKRTGTRLSPKGSDSNAMSFCEARTKSSESVKSKRSCGFSGSVKLFLVWFVVGGGCLMAWVQSGGSHALIHTYIHLARFLTRSPAAAPRWSDSRTRASGARPP